MYRFRYLRNEYDTYTYRIQGLKYHLRYVYRVECDMPEQTDWERKAANLLKAELKRQGVTYGQLADMIGEKEVNIRNKLSRGKFSAAFFLQCLSAIGSTDLRLA